MNPITDSEPSIWGFDAAHPIGSICNHECPHCHPQASVILEPGVTLPPETPFYILREATVDQFIAQVVRRYGRRPPIPPGVTYFYFVSTD